MHKIYSNDIQTCFGFMKVGPLFKLHHRSPLWITVHHIYLLCTSLHSTTPQTIVNS